MNQPRTRRFSNRIVFAAAIAVAAPAFAQTPFFTPGNIVVVVEGCGQHSGNQSTCAIANGTGGANEPSGVLPGNSTTGGYGDNQAGPLTLFQYSVSGTTDSTLSATWMNSFVLPQAASGANPPVSGEYGSSSEGNLQLTGTAQYLTLMGYGIDAPTFDAALAFPLQSTMPTACSGQTYGPYGACPSGALAQSGSLYPQSNYTPVPRVITRIDANGNVDSSTVLYNVFNNNNPRSTYSVDGATSAYVSGQGNDDATGGVFYVPTLFTTNAAPVAITGDDTETKTTDIPYAQDTRGVQIYNDTLYISVDSTEGSGFNRSFIGTLGSPPAVSLFTPPAGGPYPTGPAPLKGFGNNGGTGKVTITTGASSNGNALNNSTTKVNGVALNLINLSPVSYFFATPSILYVTDSGTPKNNSNGLNNSNDMANIGDGGLQKWANESGTWTLVYTLYNGLNGTTGLVNNGGTTGPTGLYGLAGQVLPGGTTAVLYVTTYSLADMDTTYLYGIVDTLSNTTPPLATSAGTFTLLDTAPPDSNFKGVAFTPATASLGGGAIGLKSGAQSARVWPINIGNNGPGIAQAAEITNLVLTQTRGAACTPLITSAFPVVAGTIGPGGSAVADVTINFTGCAATAFFTVTETMSANSGATTGSAEQLNQLQ